MKIDLKSVLTLKVLFVGIVDFEVEFSTCQMIPLWDCKTGWLPSQVSVLEKLGLRLKNLFRSS